MLMRMRTFQPSLNKHCQNQYLQAKPGYNTNDYELLAMWYEFSGILTSIFLIKLFEADVVTSWLVTSLTVVHDLYFYGMQHFTTNSYSNA